MSNVLVAYFSASGVTAGLAKKLAKAANADLFEIAAAEPYTKADLNWMDKNSRSSLEMKDANARPAIKSRIDSMEQYDTVFVGFPIWWYREPSIIDTFMESYDFSGKTVIPFVTSGGSGLGDSAKNLQTLAPGAKVENGRRFSALASEKELKRWVDSFAGMV
jgi:flavodoxin